MKYLKEVIDNSIRVGTKFDDPASPGHEKDSVITDVKSGKVKSKKIKTGDSGPTVDRKDFDKYKKGMNETVKEMPGHKNSQGEEAPWVIVSETDGKVISSHKSKKAAEDHLQDIEIHKSIAAKKENSMKKVLVTKTVRVENYILEAGDSIIILKETPADERLKDDKERIDRLNKDLADAKERNNQDEVTELTSELNKLKLRMAKDVVDKDDEKKREGPPKSVQGKE